MLQNCQPRNIERKGKHVPEGRNHCCGFLIRIKVSNCMVRPKQFLPIFPPRNMGVLVHVRYAD